VGQITHALGDIICSTFRTFTRESTGLRQVLLE